MPKVTIVTKPVTDKPQRSETIEHVQAEKALRKSPNWMLPQDSEYTFKDGGLFIKAKKATKKPPPKEEEEE